MTQMGSSIQVPNIALFHPGKGRQILAQEVGQGMTSVGEFIATDAREEAPVDRGILRGSIFTDIHPGQGDVLIQGIVSTGKQAPYAEDVEKGTPPHWIKDIDGLKGYAVRHGMRAGAAYAIRRKIAREGTKAQPYMRPAAIRGESRLEPAMHAAVDRAVHRLGQL